MCIAQPIRDITTMGTTGFGVVRGLDTDPHLQCGGPITMVVPITTVGIIILPIIVGDWFNNNGKKNQGRYMCTDLWLFYMTM